MPRAFTTDERTLVKAAHVTHVLRCEALDLDDTWIGLEDIIAGVDPFVGASISVTVDGRAYAATIRVTRGLGTSSLSPLMEASEFNRDADDAFFPRLNGGTRVRLYSYTLAADDDPSGDTIKLAFDGRIDDPDFTSEPMVLTCRDLGGKLLDTIATADRTYGDADDPVPLADVAQQFLTDNADLLGESITLSVVDEPTYLVTEFAQVLVGVMDALNTLAMLAGFVIRYEFNETTDAFELALLDPQREKTTPDYTLAATEYLEVEAAKLNTTNVRNRIRVWYNDGVTGEAAYQEVFDAGSIAVFGERYMALGGEQLAGIKDGNTALALAGFALSDLSTPLFDHTVRSTYTWFARIGDLVGFTQNGVHYDEDQALALVGITHEFPDGGSGAATTSFQCRGKPAGAYERWLRLQGGPVFPEVPPAPILEAIVAELSQYGGTITTVDGGVWVFYRMPKGVDEIRFFALLGDGPNLGVPNSEQSTHALTIRRPEGDIGLTPEYASIALLSTRPNMFKRIRMEGVRGGLTSKPVIAPAGDAIQAVDPTPTPVDGAIAALTTVREGSTATVTITPGTLEPTIGTNWLCVVRNKEILPPILIGTSVSPVVFTDTGLNPSTDAKYAYEAFIANIGPTWCVTGGKRLTNADAPTVVAPEWALGTPLAAVVSNTQKVQLSWTGATPGAGGVRVEASVNGTDVRTVGAGALASGTVYDAVLGPKLYRLTAYSLIPVADIVTTPWRWFTGTDNPLSNPGTLPKFANGTPKAVFGRSFPSPTLTLAVEWTCATPGAVTVRIRRSTTGSGGTYSTVPGGVSAAVASGTWKAPIDAGTVSTYYTTDAWFKLEAMAADGVTVLAASSPTHWVPPT